LRLAVHPSPGSGLAARVLAPDGRPPCGWQCILRPAPAWRRGTWLPTAARFRAGVIVQLAPAWRRESWLRTAARLAAGSASFTGPRPGSASPGSRRLPALRLAVHPSPGPGLAARVLAPDGHLPCGWRCILHQASAWREVWLRTAVRLAAAVHPSPGPGLGGTRSGSGHGHPPCGWRCILRPAPAWAARYLAPDGAHLATGVPRSPGSCLDGARSGSGPRPALRLAVLPSPGPGLDGTVPGSRRRPPHGWRYVLRLTSGLAALAHHSPEPRPCGHGPGQDPEQQSLRSKTRAERPTGFNPAPRRGVFKSFP